MPLSRLWAAIDSNLDNIELLFSTYPWLSADQSFRKIVRTLSSWKQNAVDIENSWKECLFGAEKITDTRFIEKYGLWQQAWQQWITRGKRLLYPYIMYQLNRCPKINFAIEQAVLSEHSQTKEIQSYSNLKADTRLSRRLLVNKGHQYWIKYMGGVEIAWASVFEPTKPIIGTFIYCHGLGVENELAGLPKEPEIAMLPQLGIRVIRLESAGHGRRRSTGFYDGEILFATAPQGILKFLQQQNQEIAWLISYARQLSQGPVALGGTSLGAISSLFYVTSWQSHHKQQPDILYLSAPDPDPLLLAYDSMLCQQSGLSQALRKYGWNQERLRLYQTQIGQCYVAPLDPANIIINIAQYDTVTSPVRAQQLVFNWKIPKRNIFLRRQGHFTLQLGLLAESQPLYLLQERMQQLTHQS
ncbi:MAG: hypothetical protein JNK86_06995 [Alphaproteobacteria bacterium]|nr:hypothetical protein [Alphaproteobacteria bacterium]